MGSDRSNRNHRTCIPILLLSRRRSNQPAADKLSGIPRASWDLKPFNPSSGPCENLFPFAGDQAAKPTTVGVSSIKIAVRCYVPATFCLLRRVASKSWRLSPAIPLLDKCPHHPRASIEMADGTTFHFVTDGIHAALNRAREAGKGRDIRLGGGVATIRQYL